MHSRLRSLLQRHACSYKSTIFYHNISIPIINLYSNQTSLSDNNINYDDESKISKNINKNDSTIQSQTSPTDQEALKIQQIIKLHSTKPPKIIENILSKCGLSLNENLVLNVLKRNQCDWKSAYAFFDYVVNGKILNGYSPNSSVYNEVLNILGRNKQFDIVNEVFDEMHNRKNLIDNETWEVVVHRYAAAHMVDEAIGLFCKRGDLGLELDLISFQMLLKWLCRYKHVDEAETFFHNEKGGFEDDIKTWNIILGGWCVMGNLREAKRFWKDIMTSKCRPDKYTYGIYINALSKKGKINSALKVFRAMSAEGCTPDVTICNTIIHGLCFKNRVPEALEMLNRMKEKGDKLNVVTYNTLIQHLCKIERMDKVAEVLDEMKEQGKECMPNTRTYSFLLSVAKDPKEVYDILDTMENNGCQMVTDTYNLLLRLFLNWGFDDKLASTWYEMEKSGVGPDERSYAIMIHGFHYKGKIEDALSYYHEMTLKGMIPEPQTKSLFDDMNDKLKQRNKQTIVSSFK